MSVIMEEATSHMQKILLTEIQQVSYCPILTKILWRKTMKIGFLTGRMTSSKAGMIGYCLENYFRKDLFSHLMEIMMTIFGGAVNQKFCLPIHAAILQQILSQRVSKIITVASL